MLVDCVLLVDMENNYRKAKHRVDLIIYHRVWTPKRRKPVLTGNVTKDCKALLEGKCKE